MFARNESYSLLAVILGVLLALELFGTDVPNGKSVAPPNTPTKITAYR